MDCDMMEFVLIWASALIFLIYPKRTFVRITAFSLLSINNYTVL